MEQTDWRDLARGLLRLAVHLGAAPEEAEDLVHEVLAAHAAAPHRHDPSRGPLLPYLRLTLRSRFIDGRRHDAMRRRKAPELVSLPSPPTQDQVLAAAEARQRRDAFLARLEPDHRQLFLCWVQQSRGDCDASQAARSLGLSVAAYEAAKKRLRRRCRSLLEEMGFRPSDLLSPEGSAA